VNFIDYKRTAHWLPRISKGIADRLIHDPIERTNEPTKLLKWLQEYERCLLAAITKRMNLNCPVVETNEITEPNNNDLELNCDRLSIF